MNVDRLRRTLLGSSFVRAVEWYDEVDSTNDVLRRLAAAGAPTGTVVLAGAQTHGRGRLGRRWDSPPGLGLYLSVLLRPAVPLVDVSRFTLGAAVAACEACHRVGAGAVRIEWPNDLTADGRKLAGILAEMRSGAGPVELILGTGFNVGHGADDFPAGVNGTSLALLARGRAPDRETLAVDYLGRLGAISFELEGSRWEAIARRWEALSPTGRGHPVQVTRGNGVDRFAGVTAGLASDGRLRVRDAAGHVEEVHAADAVDYVER